MVGHRLEIIIDHRLASVAADDAIFRLESFLNNSLWRACFTVNPCSWSYVYKFIQLYCTTTELYIYKAFVSTIFQRFGGLC